jgi:hypothetical protein
MLKPDWLPARELRLRLADEGIGEADLLRLVAWAALSGRLVASGFRTIHTMDNHLSAGERAIVSHRLWRVFERVDPAFDQIEASAKSQFQRIVRWDAGEFTWTLDHSEQDWNQETWSAVHFDRITAESLLAEIRERAEHTLLQDFEIDDWIRESCQASSKNAAWIEFSRTFGRRAVKRDPTFIDAWRRVKGRRARGRPSSPL